MHWCLHWDEWLFSSQFSQHSPTDLMITNMALGWCPFLSCASLRNCRVFFRQVSCIPSISTSLAIFIFGVFLRYWLCRWMLAFWFTRPHDPHLATAQCVTFVFLHNGWFIVPAKVFHVAGYAIDQHCMRTDYPINLSFEKSAGVSAL